MPQIEIRPSTAADLPVLVTLIPHYTSDHVWQMESSFERETGEVITRFHKVRLPRAVRVEYPRSISSLLSGGRQHASILVALLADKPVGFVALDPAHLPDAAWVTDLVVHLPLRRQGIGTALLMAASEWAANWDRHYLLLEMQTKNFPAIQMAQKLGFEFCGYNDSHYPNHEIGIFYKKAV